MTIKIQTNWNKKARFIGSRILLEHLKPEEAAEVLRRMLKARPDLANEAERIANTVLTEVAFEDIALEVEDAVTGVDIGDVYARGGQA